MHPDDAKRVRPAALRETAAELLAAFGEDDGARLILLCADRIDELEKKCTAPMHYESNGEAGDGQVICDGCQQEIEPDVPHTWKECAARLDKTADACLNQALEAADERDVLRADLDALLAALPVCTVRSCPNVQTRASLGGNVCDAHNPHGDCESLPWAPLVRRLGEKKAAG